MRIQCCQFYSYMKIRSEKVKVVLVCHKVMLLQETNGGCTQYELSLISTQLVFIVFFNDNTVTRLTWLLHS
jgi:hypothetical protein